MKQNTERFDVLTNTTDEGTKIGIIVAYLLATLPKSSYDYTTWNLEREVNNLAGESNMVADSIRNFFYGEKFVILPDDVVDYLEDHKINYQNNPAIAAVMLLKVTLPQKYTKREG